MATAKIWIDDFRKKYFPKKKKGQIYFQTWHGFITLKHVERDAVNILTTEYLKQAKRDAMNSDYMLSGTRNTTKLYLNSFWFNGEVLEFGTPRMDEILKSNSANIAKANVALNLSEEDNILLYAPTFRENSKKAFDIYNLNFDDLRVRLGKRFGGNWKIVVKLHPNIKELESKLIGNGTCIGASNFDNIQSLILRARIVVTDFSSLMFDAMVAGKIVSLYAPDADEYEAKRGLYFKISELPFDLAKNGEMLAEHLVNFDKLTYKNNVKMFEKKIGLLEDGNASQRVAEYILKKMNE